MATRTRKSKPTTDSQGALIIPSSLIVIQPPSQLAITTALDKAKAVLTLVEAKVQSLVISSQQTYSDADKILDDIREGERVVEAEFEEIIKALREPLDQFYALRRSVAVPLGEYLTLVKNKMVEWNQIELARINKERQENEKKAREIEQRLRKENEDRLRAQAEQLQVPTNVVEAIFTTPVTVPDPPPVTVTYLSPPTAPAPRAQHSTVRTKPKWRITDRDLFVDAAMAEMIPLDTLTINSDRVDAYFAADPKSVAQWPGVEVYDDISIAGR